METQGQDILQCIFYIRRSHLFYNFIPQCRSPLGKITFTKFTLNISLFMALSLISQGKLPQDIGMFYEHSHGGSNVNRYTIYIFFAMLQLEMTKLRCFRFWTSETKISTAKKRHWTQKRLYSDYQSGGNLPIKKELQEMVTWNF